MSRHAIMMNSLRLIQLEVHAILTRTFSLRILVRGSYNKLKWRTDLDRMEMIKGRLVDKLMC